MWDWEGKRKARRWALASLGFISPLMSLLISDPLSVMSLASTLPPTLVNILASFWNMWVPHPRTIAPLLREFMLSWLAGKQTCYLLLLELFILKPPIFLSFLLILAVLAKQRWRLFHEKESPWILLWYKVYNKIKKGNTIFSKCTRWQIGCNSCN